MLDIRKRVDFTGTILDDRYWTRRLKMNDKRSETNEELDCLVTVNDGSYMTCDKIEEETSDEEDGQEIKKSK
jgi:hypothetical protein